MGKKRWRRVRLADLASAAVQERLLEAVEQAQRLPEAESPGKQPSETPQAQR